MLGQHYINGQWQTGKGKIFTSENPATGEIIWQGTAATEEEIQLAVSAAKKALPEWSDLPFEKRLHYLEHFNEILKQQQSVLVEILSKETGKPAWEATTEIAAMMGKLPVSIEAYRQRCQEMIKETPTGLSTTFHRPLGIMAVYAPFNFPAHIPNGHIIPALLAGNVVILKPSELTPLVSEAIMEYWHEANLPPGVMNLVQGDGDTGATLSKHPDINGLLFTGSYKTGRKIARQFADYPEKMLALEMGGNNPLVVCRVADKNRTAAVYHTIQSAYITAGQRCTCARRLILIKNTENEQFLEALIATIRNIKIGAYTEKPEPFMGTVISNNAAKKILDSVEGLMALGAKPLVNMQRIHDNLPFLSPGLLEVTSIKNLPDEEIFGPVLQVIWVEDFAAAILEANRTQYGLIAGILTDDEAQYKEFNKRVRAGLINLNRATTGSSSHAPFGGIGHSGNYRPSGYYAVDYCAYPLATLTVKTLELPKSLSPGIEL
jgi:succinylglutamic semialdehyde dehydrogenase